MMRLQLALLLIQGSYVWASAVNDDETSLIQVNHKVQEGQNEPLDTEEEECHVHGHAQLKFDEYIQKHKKTYVVGSAEYKDRLALFEKTATKIREHNCRPGKRDWTMGHNFLSDHTSEELARIRGRGKSSQSKLPTGGGGSVAVERLGALQSQATTGRRDSVEPKHEKMKVPESFDWGNISAFDSAHIINQGQCGSCWASATTKMLEAHAEIYGTPQTFSIQQIVSCTPNPQSCGGSGKCNGSTGELALDYVYHNGLSTDKAFPYTATDNSCPTSMTALNPEPTPQPVNSSSAVIAAANSGALSFGMIGWSKLPPNDLNPLYAALYQEGPVAVSVVASDYWNNYFSGIMTDGCDSSHIVVNHLVVLYGWGVDQSTKYWQVQNSWSNSWGESGHIRLVRQEDSTEAAQCGWDNDPLIGTGCIGDPAKVWVCGSCGILYDNVIPHFTGTTAMAQEMLRRRTLTYAAPTM